MNQFERYYKAIAYLEGLPNLALNGDYMSDHKHPGRYLKRMRYFLDLLGNPDKGFKYIHITGTAGKGTVTTMLHEILLASRKKVGSFTSPFVTTSIEKVRVGNEYISPNELADIVEHLKPLIDKVYLKGPYGRPSYFEIWLAIALLYFKKQKCEWVVLEVGAGGRYDATNVIKNPEVTAITNIDYDHTEIFGKTLKKIAFEKVGIIKKSSAFFTSEQRNSLTQFFRRTSEKVGASFNQIPKQENYMEYNKALARAISQSLGIKDAYIDQGIKNTRLQCRFETVQKKPLVVLDGAHNRSKIQSTVYNIQTLEYKKLHLIVGMADNKDHLTILKQIIPLADHVYATRFQTKERKTAHPKELAAKSRKYLKNKAVIEIFLDAEQALQKAVNISGPEDLVLVTGSFFLAGELRKNWFSEDSILKARKSFD
jgi:dihydrofolate synthase/folylpolyglutamate synthase